MAMAKTRYDVALGLLALLLLAFDVHSTGCPSGEMQSPIDISRNNISWNKNLTSLRNEYKPAKAVLINHEYGVGIKMEGDAGVLIVDNKNYSLSHLLWRTPAEHTVDNVRHPAELQLVHKAADGAVSVLAIHFKLGRPDPFVCLMDKGLKELAKESCGADEEAHIPIGILRFKFLKLYPRDKYFRYMGSLTVPPCTKNVLWNIVAKVRDISKEQLDVLKAPLDANSVLGNSMSLPNPNSRQVETFYRA